jgi:hypothetical protein
LVFKHLTNESCLKLSILQPAACSTNRADWCLLRGRAGGSLAGQGRGVQWSANHAAAVNHLKVKGSVLSERTDGGADSACRYCGENTNLLAVAGPLARRPSRQQHNFFVVVGDESSGAISRPREASEQQGVRRSFLAKFRPHHITPLMHVGKYFR